MRAGLTLCLGAVILFFGFHLKVSNDAVFIALTMLWAGYIAGKRFDDD